MKEVCFPFFMLTFRTIFISYRDIVYVCVYKYEDMPVCSFDNAKK